MHRALASTLSALILIGCGFATEPDPGHGNLDGGAFADASTGGGGAGGGGGEGGMGGAGGGAFLDAMIPGDPDYGAAPDANLDAALADAGSADMEIPVPVDMGCPGDGGDAGCEPCDCAPCDCGDGAVCDCADLGSSCLDECVDFGPLCDAPECVDLGVE